MAHRPLQPGPNTGQDSVQASAEADVAVPSNAVTQSWAATVNIPSATQGWIGQPIDQDTVSDSVPITIGPGITLSQGNVTYWPATDPTNVTVLSPTAQGGPGTTLATLDTTTLRNGSYVIQVDGTDSGGQRLISRVLVTVSGENKPGRLTFSVTDLTVPLAGIPITITRTYDSLERGRVGDFGHGWSLGLSTGLEVDPAHNVTLREPSGRRVTFAFTPTSYGGTFGYLFKPAYTPEPGVFGTLTANGCNLLVLSAGQPICFLDGAYQPTAYTYTDPQGRVFTIGADGDLQSIRDLNGNTLTVSSTGITSSVGGVSVTFVRDASNRITQVTDPLGAAFYYSYDAAGDLTSVSLPGAADPITYTYDTSHFFLSVTDPRGGHPASTTRDADGRLETVTDALGSVTHFAYDLASHTTTQTNPDLGVVVKHFDEQGQLLSETDPLGYTRSYTYDGNRNQLTETNELGETTHYTYDTQGNMASVTDPLGHATQLTYGPYRNPIKITDALGRVQTFTYDASFQPITLSDALGTRLTITWDRNGQPLEIVDADGGLSGFTYDAVGYETSRADPLGYTTESTYDQMGRRASSTDPLGNTTQYEYDAIGQLITVTEPLGKVTRYEYDGNGNRTAEVDALGRRTTNAYDAANHLVTVTYPDTTTRSYTYNFRGQRLTETDELDRTTLYTYDLRGKLIQTTYPDSSTVGQTFDAAGRLESRTDERGDTTTYEYPPGCACDKRISREVDALQHATTREFDALGRLSTVTDPTGRVTRYTYDARDRLIGTTNPDGTTMRFSYDGAGHRLSVTDEAGVVTTYGYDAAGHLVEVTDALAHTTRYASDAMGHQTTITDALGHATLTAYDALGRETGRTLPLGMSEAYAYNAAGERLEKVDFNGRQTAYTYDARGRMLTKVPDPVLSQPAISYTYTPTGQRASMSDGTGTTTYQYDGRDRVTSKGTPEGTLTYGRDTVGNVVSVDSSHTGGTSVTYGYDAANRLSSVTDNAGGGTTTYEYDEAGRMVTVTSPNGVVATSTYDPAGRLVDLRASQGTGTLLKAFTYTLAPTGHRLGVLEETGASIEYVPDALRQLTAEVRGNGRIDYVYDAVGNRLERTSTVAGIPSTTATYDANDRLTADSYDANGNTLSTGSTQFGYDFENRLTSADGMVFTYDGDGNRVAQTAGGVITTFLVDDQNPTGYTQVVEEVSGGDVQRRLVYGRELISQTRVLQGEPSTSFYGYDGPGSVRYLADEQGTMTDAYEYDAFGNLTLSTGSTPNQYLYNSEQFDGGLGLYYLRARYYRPDSGRFLSMDPLPSVNPYPYVSNNPVNLTDPSGAGDLAEYISIGSGALTAVVTVCVFHHSCNCYLKFFAHSFACNLFHAGQYPAISVPECKDRAKANLYKCLHGEFDPDDGAKATGTYG